MALFLQRKCALFYGYNNGALLGQSYDLYKDFVGVAHLPGSRKILDRSTGGLVECTAQTCPYAKYEEGLGLVNYAPASGSIPWVGVVDRKKGPERKIIVRDFFALVGNHSLGDVIRETNQTKLMPNPYRRSHLFIDDWLEKGYDEEFAKSSIAAYDSAESINVALYPPVNGVVDMIIMLENGVHQYLNATRGYSNEFTHEKTEASLKMMLEDQIDKNGRNDIFEQYEKYLDQYKEPSSNQYLDGGLQAYGLFLSGAVLFTSFAFVAWMRKHRKEYVVIHSQPQVLNIACCGIVLMGAAIIPKTMDDKWLSIESCNNMCVLYPWLYFVGLSMMLSALFCKIERIILVHEKPNDGLSLHVSFDELKKSVMYSVMPNVVILLIWTIFRPNYWERSYVHDDEDTFLSSYPDTVGKCVGDNANYTVIYIVLLLYNYSICFTRCIRLYKCTQNGKVTLDNWEDKWITSAIMATFEPWLIGIPVLLLLANNYSSQYFVEVSLFAFTALASLAFLFVPKYFYLRDKRSNQGPFAESALSEQGYKIRSDDPNKFLQHNSEIEEKSDGEEGLLFLTILSVYHGGEEDDGNDELRKRLIALQEENKDMKNALQEFKEEEKREIEAIPPSMFLQVTS